jgi:hypothetical protein
MCDYSLQNVAFRAANVGDKLVTTNFGTGSRGFAGIDDPKVAVCVLPGTELAFDVPIRGMWVPETAEGHTTAIFRQIHRNEYHRHHDALELPDGSQVMLTYLAEGQMATVLQLPAAPKTEKEVKEQTRMEIVG